MYTNCAHRMQLPPSPWTFHKLANWQPPFEGWHSKHWTRTIWESLIQTSELVRTTENEIQNYKQWTQMVSLAPCVLGARLKPNFCSLCKQVCRLF